MAEKQLSLKVPIASLVALRAHLRAVQRYLDVPKIAEVVNLWPTLPEEVKERIRRKAPTFSELVDLAERFNR